jgi:hypothetical protein
MVVQACLDDCLSTVDTDQFFFPRDWYFSYPYLIVAGQWVLPVRYLERVAAGGFMECRPGQYHLPNLIPSLKPPPAISRNRSTDRSASPESPLPPTS